MAEDMGLRALAEARRWLATPYIHQASCCGAGTDCLGLIRGIWRGLYGAEPETVPPYGADWAEAGGSEDLWRAAERWLSRKALDAPELGDVLLFRMRDRGGARHLGLQSALGPEARFIHAYSGHEVTESPLSLPWARRIVARFAFPFAA